MASVQVARMTLGSMPLIIRWPGVRVPPAPPAVSRTGRELVAAADMIAPVLADVAVPAVEDLATLPAIPVLVGARVDLPVAGLHVVESHVLHPGRLIQGCLHVTEQVWQPDALVDIHHEGHLGHDARVCGWRSLKRSWRSIDHRCGAFVRSQRGASVASAVATLSSMSRSSIGWPLSRARKYSGAMRVSIARSIRSGLTFLSGEASRNRDATASKRVRQKAAASSWSSGSSVRATARAARSRTVSGAARRPAISAANVRRSLGGWPVLGTRTASWASSMTASAARRARVGQRR